MKIKLGIAPIAWSNDDMPELGGDTPIEQCLEEASAAGFTGIELGGKFPRNPGITNFLLNKYKLKMPGGWYGSLLRTRSAEDEWVAMEDHLNLLKYLKQLLLFSTYIGYSSPSLYDLNFPKNQLIPLSLTIISSPTSGSSIGLS